MIIGCHLSISKGLPQAYQEATTLGANTFQFFTRNPRGSKARSISTREKAEWLELKTNQIIEPIVAHLPYTINAASPEIKKREFARDIILTDLRRMSELQIDYLVIHPGNFTKGTLESGLDNISNVLSWVFERYTGHTKLCLETMSGKGTEIGRSISELAAIFSNLQSPPQLGLCLDSCHLFASGYDFVKPDQVQKLVNDLESTIGMDRVYLSHLNDSKESCGSHKDRHERVTKGKIGQIGLNNYLRHPQLMNLPFILETPVGEAKNYRDEILAARNIVL